MTLRPRALYLWLPLGIAAGYLLAVCLLPSAWRRWFVSESGPIELGTAALFFAAAGIAVGHCCRHRGQVRGAYRWLFGLFAAAAVLVALEEMSYGQHLVGFRSPAWFEANNVQGEFNLHNVMGSKPSRRVRLAANVGFPVCCVGLPLIAALRRDPYLPPGWAWHLLPRLELVPTVLLAAVITIPTRLPTTSVNMDQLRVGELKELYWSLAAVLYISLIYRRHAGGGSAAETLRFPVRAEPPAQAA